jgi:hypothetical protein
MSRKVCLFVFCALFAFSSASSLAKDHGKHGKGKGQGHYDSRERETILAWYHEQGSNLPPGLAGKDRLPPGLEKQLQRRGTLPPGLQKKIQPCPPELERRLPPPPDGYSHTVISGHIVLVNRHTYAVLDVFRVVR